jgi:glycine C-acetyltransferase
MVNDRQAGCVGPGGRCVKDLIELVSWFGWRAPHVGSSVVSLPDPSFRDHSGEFVSFSTNNYLALSASPRLKAAAIEGIERYGVGNCESRLLTGNLAIYAELENKLARSKGQARALLFPTGYLANVGTLSSLPRAAHYARPLGFTPSAPSEYAYFSDELNHISIREGIRASGAARVSYRHRDLNHLSTLLERSAATNKIVVTDGVFSQDGDIAPIPELLRLAERHNAYLYIDDAHGTGVLGATGGGVLEHFGVSSERVIYMGTLSKAYGAIGGFIATNAYLVEILRLTCPAFGFTSTLPPDQALAVSVAVDIVANEPEHRERLWANHRYFVAKLKALPYQATATDTPIVPLMIGDEKKAEELATSLRTRSLHVDPIQFPAVPLGRARIRIQLNAGHTPEQIDRLIEALRDNAHVLDPSVLASSRAVAQPSALSGR